MELKVLRQVFTGKSTIGQLLVNGKFECWTLEDVVRPAKVFGETAIPAGTYQVVISMSERFKTRLPLLVDVPEYSGVRIHPGNTAADTLGCILVGQTKGTDSIGASQLAFKALLPKMEAAARSEKITIEIVNDGKPVGAPGGAARAPARPVKPVALGTPYKAPAVKQAAVAKKAAAPKKAVAGTKAVASKKAPASKKTVASKKAVASKPVTAPKQAVAPKKAATPRKAVLRKAPPGH